MNIKLIHQHRIMESTVHIEFTYYNGVRLKQINYVKMKTLEMLTTAKHK